MTDQEHRSLVPRFKAPYEEILVEEENFSERDEPETDQLHQVQKNFSTTRQSSRFPGKNAQNFSEKSSRNPQKNRPEFPRNSPEFSPEFSQDFSTHSSQNAGNFWPKFLQNHARFHHHFVTHCVETGPDFERFIPQMLAKALENSLGVLEKHAQKRLRFHQVFYQHATFFEGDCQYFFIYGTVIAEPYRGLLDFLRRA